MTYPENAYTLPVISEPASLATQGRSIDKQLIGGKERELCLQWYQPCYDDVRVGGVGGEKTRGIYLLYAITRPAEKGSAKTKKGTGLIRMPFFISMFKI